MKQTLVIGSAVVDVIINIPHLPKTGEDVHITRQTRSLGGCAYNVSDILRWAAAFTGILWRKNWKRGVCLFMYAVPRKMAAVTVWWRPMGSVPLS